MNSIGPADHGSPRDREPAHLASVEAEDPREGSARTTLRIMSVLIALAFLFVGLPKLLFPTNVATWFEHWGYTIGFMKVVGTVETLGAALLLVSRFAIVGALMLIVIMIGALYTHFSHAEYVHLARPLIFLSALVMIIVLRRRVG